uniref:Peptidase S1 domain-containing protein n=1 Tax=Musca domestica TaxID=7370 RepID=A0A1I8MZQ1_MUSDO
MTIFNGIVYLTTCLLLLLSPASSQSTQSLARIVGGTKTTINNVPYLVQLRQQGNFICGGTLVAPRFVVTAAHCVIGIRPGQLTVVGGATRLSQRGVRRAVRKVIRPSSFTMKNLSRDVAVLKLASPMRGSNTRPIALNTAKLSRNMSVRVSGWGLTKENSNRVSAQVRTVTVPIISKARCAANYRQLLTLTPTMFCAAAPGKDACTGDSGGPAVCNGRLCGVVSFGYGCARSNFPGIYTSIRSVQGIIRKALKQ